MNVFLDIDEVIFYWNEGYSKRFNCKIPKRWDKSDKMQSRLSLLSKEKSFWLNLSVKNKPDFQPSGFVSARNIPKTWTIESLKRNDIPGRSHVHQVNWGESKIELLKSLKCDIFIDDKYETFKECNENGIFCLLMDADHNRHIKTKYRIYDLNIHSILTLWCKLK